MSCNRIHRGDLDAYVCGELSVAEAASLESHLFGCQDCATELRHLRQEKRLFRVRADADTEQVPAFEDVLLRIAGEESGSPVDDEDARRDVAIAKITRPLPRPPNVDQPRAGEGKHVFPRWAQALVACAATAAATVSFVGVTPPKTDGTPVVHAQRSEMEIGADPVCTTENSSASAEVLASLPPPREVQTKASSPSGEDFSTCGDNIVESCESTEEPMEPACGEQSSAICGESGP